MKKIIVAMSIVVLGLVSPVFASDDPLKKGTEGAVETFAEGCQNELAGNKNQGVHHFVEVLKLFK